ncbi:hypothetical protein HDU87_002678 [Geranomyces variabilis]|uniref:Uncharacterized protein n=1 Tax=Geranomyces variabilis TaxID=109894 RepID=A0AAD5TUJ0_9FUNG|nr:hypothetical protein HDU87_002678 [Geranomyces variabilis]
MSSLATPLLLARRTATATATAARPLAFARPAPVLPTRRSAAAFFSSTPQRPQATPDPEKTPPKDDDPWLYSPDRDPMKNMSEAEKDEIRKTIRTESQRAFSVGYGIIGGGMLAVGIAVFFSLNNKKH